MLNLLTDDEIDALPPAQRPAARLARRNHERRAVAYAMGVCDVSWDMKGPAHPGLLYDLPYGLIDTERRRALPLSWGCDAPSAQDGSWSWAS